MGQCWRTGSRERDCLVFIATLLCRRCRCTLSRYPGRPFGSLALTLVFVGHGGRRPLLRQVRRRHSSVHHGPRRVSSSVLCRPCCLYAAAACCAVVVRCFAVVQLLLDGAAGGCCLRSPASHALRPPCSFLLAPGVSGLLFHAAPIAWGGASHASYCRLLALQIVLVLYELDLS